MSVDIYTYTLKLDHSSIEAWHIAYSILGTTFGRESVLDHTHMNTLTDVFMYA